MWRPSSSFHKIQFHKYPNQVLLCIPGQNFILFFIICSTLVARRESNMAWLCSWQWWELEDSLFSKMHGWMGCCLGGSVSEFKQPPLCSQISLHWPSKQPLSQSLNSLFYIPWNSLSRALKTLSSDHLKQQLLTLWKCGLIFVQTAAYDPFKMPTNLLPNGILKGSKNPSSDHFK